MGKGIGSVIMAEKGREVSKGKLKVFIIEGGEKIRRRAIKPKPYFIFSMLIFGV